MSAKTSFETGSYSIKIPCLLYKTKFYICYREKCNVEGVAKVDINVCKFAGIVKYTRYDSQWIYNFGNRIQLSFAFLEGIHMGTSDIAIQGGIHMGTSDISMQGGIHMRTSYISIQGGIHMGTSDINIQGGIQTGTSDISMLGGLHMSTSDISI